MIDLKLVHEHTKGLEILFVEDNKQLRESTSGILENFFQHVDTACDGKDGLEKYHSRAKEHTEPYDLIITDINMPQLDGLEMSEKILEVDPTQAIICLTAYNESDYLLKAIQLGISSFLIKPLNLHELNRVLFKVCRGICDRKIVEKHYIMIEEMNTQLLSQNEVLEEKQKEQEKLIRILDTMIALKEGAATTQHIEKVTPHEESVDIEDQILQENQFYAEQIRQFIEEDLSELQKIHESLDADIISIMAGRTELIPSLSELFARYGTILRMYPCFESLSGAMGQLVQAMRENAMPKDSNNYDEIFSFLETFIYILGKWQQDIILKQNESFSHIDLSIIGDLETITNLWKAVCRR